MLEAHEQGRLQLDALLPCLRYSRLYRRYAPAGCLHHTPDLAEAHCGATFLTENIQVELVRGQTVVDDQDFGLNFGEVVRLHAWAAEVSRRHC